MILASVLAKAVPAITPEVADSSAAIVVSVLILLSLAPLFTGMVKSIVALRRVNAQLEEEERKEARGMVACLMENEEEDGAGGGEEDREEEGGGGGEMA